MDPLGIGIVGTGNIAGGYARDILTHPEIHLVAATDLDPAGRARSARSYGCTAHATLDELLARPGRRHRGQPDRPSRALRGDPAGARGRPSRLQREAARPPLGRGARARRPCDDAGLRLGCSPSTFLGEAQQTAAALDPDDRLGTVRAVYADVNWGRIETWHPAPAPFFDVGVLVDVGVYPLTLVTAMLGPARSVRAWGWELSPDRVNPRRQRRSGSAARTSSSPRSSSMAARSSG